MSDLNRAKSEASRHQPRSASEPRRNSVHKPRHFMIECVEPRVLFTAVGFTEVECPPADPPPTVELPPG